MIYYKDKSDAESMLILDDICSEIARSEKFFLARAIDGSDLLKQVEDAFKPIIDKVENHELIAPYSNYHYNADGTLNYRTDHTAEGTVHGGYNPKKPNATF